MGDHNGQQLQNYTTGLSQKSIYDNTLNIIRNNSDNIPSIYLDENLYDLQKPIGKRLERLTHTIFNEAMEMRKKATAQEFQQIT